MNDAERGTWADLMALANECRNRGCKEGVIQANSNTPYTHAYIAGLLNIPLDLFEKRLEKFSGPTPEEARIYENGDGIHLVNFEYYNSSPAEGRGPGRPSKKAKYRFLQCSKCGRQIHCLKEEQEQELLGEACSSLPGVHVKPGCKGKMEKPHMGKGV